MADATKELSIVISARDEASKTLQGFSSKLKGLKDDFRDTGILFAGIGAASAVTAKGFIEAAGKMEATRTAFKVLIGNSKEAEATLKDLYTLEARTPFTLETVMTESKKLLAMGTSTKDLIKTMTMLGDVASGVGFDKLPQLTLAFGQIQAKGRLMGTELRQLTEAGFNLADAMGVSNAKLEEMVSNGEVGFNDVATAFAKVTGEGGRFHGMMDALSQTTPGRLSTLESSIFKLQAAMGEALLPALNKIIDAVIPAMEAFAKFASEHQTLITVVVAAGLALGALGTAMLILLPIISGITGLISILGFTFTTVGTIIMGIVGVLGGPLTVVILAVMALIGLLTAAWKNNWGDIQGKTKMVVDWFKNTAWPIIKEVGSLIMKVIEALAESWISKFNMMKAVVDGVVGAIRGIVSAAENMANKLKGGLKIPGFQHGGFIPGSFDQAVPAILHGGERVVPRVGTDVNGGGGGGGLNLTLNFSGAVSMDSDSRVQELADKIVNILGRQNELAARGISI